MKIFGGVFVNFDRQISKFLAATILGSSIMPCFSSHILGMESKKSDWEIINDLSKNILSFIKTRRDYKLFEEIYFCLIAVLTDPNNYNFYKPGITLDVVLYKIRDWMKEPSSNVSIFKSNHKKDGYSLDPERFKKFIPSSQEAIEFIDFIFEKITSNIKAKPANYGNMQRLYKSLDKAETLIRGKWMPITYAYDGLYDKVDYDAAGFIKSRKNLNKGIKLLKKEAKCLICKQFVSQNGVFGNCSKDHVFVFHRDCWKYRLTSKCPRCTYGIITIDLCFGV